MSDTSVRTAPQTGDGPSESLDSSILRVLMETSTDRIYFKDLQSRFVRNNVTHAHALGAASPEDCIGKTDFDFFSREHAERAFADEQEIIRSGTPMIAKTERITKLDGSHGWASSTKMPWRDASGRIIGTFGVTRDITATKEAEERLKEERNLLRTIIDHLPSRLYVKDTASRYVLNNRAHLDAIGVENQEEATGHITTDFFPGERGLQALADDRQVFATRTPIISQEKSDFGPEGDVHWALVTKVPLHDTHHNLIGLVGISHDITHRKRVEEELRRRGAEMEADLRMACQVQESFLSRPYPSFPAEAPPEKSALRFAHRYVPTSTLGGDFFDIVRISDTHCGVLVCDVMGHGVRAGLLTALLRGVVEEMGPRAADPTHVLKELNHALMPIVEHTGQPVFATAFFGVIDTVRHTLAYGNAGHPPPLIHQVSTGAIQRLAPADPEPAAGLVGDFPYTGHTVGFAPGDMLLAYTDGVLEACDSANQMFGEERLRAILAGAPRPAGPALLDQVLQAVKTHCASDGFDDDVCLVAIEAAR